MNAPPCPRCWRPHTMASPCGASRGRLSPLWDGGCEEQRIADRAERLAIDRFVHKRRTAG
jgi:hypothetical protein